MVAARVFGLGLALNLHLANHETVVRAVIAGHERAVARDAGAVVAARHGLAGEGRDGGTVHVGHKTLLGLAALALCLRLARCILRLPHISVNKNLASILSQQFHHILIICKKFFMFNQM